MKPKPKRKAREASVWVLEVLQIYGDQSWQPVELGRWSEMQAQLRGRSVKAAPARVSRYVRAAR